ncbi:MAG TPA: type II secretion system F family protein [Bryobacteraceae bacterium]|nr:type II secretion system F family protein [Bryobacteraceae bacterium]
MPLSTLVPVIFLIMLALVLLVVGMGMRVLEAERRKKVTEALRTAGGMVQELEPAILVETAPEKTRLAFADLPAVRALNARIQQAGLSWTPQGLLLATLGFAVAGGFLGSRVPVPVFREFAALGGALLAGCLPYFYVSLKRRRRLAAFEEQFPETLDFLARSLQAGHAFSVALETLAEESPEPVATEFRHLFHEQNLGAPLDVAMRNLAARVPLLDVRYFVSAVLLQRETGGNLAEILTCLANIIRERFRLKGHVRAVSAHGRITALVLTVMPVVTAILLMLIAPGYLNLLANDPHGKYLIIGTIAGMALGYYWMKRIIDIKV